MVRKVVETIYCDVDIAQQNDTLVIATHYAVPMPFGEPLDMCDHCLEVISKSLGVILSPDGLITIASTLKIEKAIEGAMAHVIPEKGSPEYYAGMRAFADAQNPPIRYMFGKQGQEKITYSPKLRQLYSDNLERLKSLQNE